MNKVHVPLAKYFYVSKLIGNNKKTRKELGFKVLFWMHLFLLCTTCTVIAWY